MSELIAFVTAHKWTVACALLGLACAILLLTAGFWRTLLLCALAGGGFALGRELDAHGSARMGAWLRRAVGRVFGRERDA